MRFLLLAFVAAIPLVFLLPWSWHREIRLGLRAETGLASALPLLEGQVESQTAAIALPEGWRTVQTSGGLTAYAAPSAEVPIVLPTSGFSAFRMGEGNSRSAFNSAFTSAANRAANGAADGAFDGTRKPYVTDVSVRDLKQVAPGLYQWSGVWEGEGYDRVLDQQVRDQQARDLQVRDQQVHLVSPREGGADIQLNVSWDATITNPNQPNFVVTVESSQDQTAQLTNFSAFLTDTASGETLDRIDFGQLPPLYSVTLSYDGLDAETKTLPPLGKVSFAYHIRPDQIESYFPLQLAAENQLLDQRLKQFAELESQGWVIKEVPPPSFAENG